MRYFITGVAGFIGFHLARRLLSEGQEVCGFDGLTAYYDPQLKAARLDQLRPSSRFTFVEGRLEDRETLSAAVGGFAPDVVVHLAAQAGVRYSIEAPYTYVESNLIGTFNVLELVREVQPSHFLFASTSSVYGANSALAFRESDSTRHPMSLYAATKKSGEVMSHAYSHLFDVPTTCFRFFTVYGPWGRPDMALFKFVDRIERDEPIEIYGHGDMSRDFTFIDDLVYAICALAQTAPVRGKPIEVEGGEDTLSPIAPWRVVNIAGGAPVGLMEFVSAVESNLGKEARKTFLPMQPGDVPRTSADSALLKALIGYEPSTDVKDGVREFVGWYRAYKRSCGDS